MVRASADSDQSGFVTFFNVLFDVKMCQFALLMLKFVIVVWGYEFSLRFLTVIILWSLHLGLSVIFQDRMGCKDGDAIVRSFDEFEVLDVHVCLPSFIMFSFFLTKSKTLTPLTSFSGLPHI